MAVVFGLRYKKTLEAYPLFRIDEETELPVIKEEISEFSDEEKWELLNGKKLRLEGE
jgi:hypothetical protein